MTECVHHVFNRTDDPGKPHISFSLDQKTQEKYHLLPFSPSFSWVWFVLLSELFQLHLAAYDCRHLHKPGVMCNITGWLSPYSMQGILLLLFSPNRMVFLACKQFPPLCTAAQELYCEWSKNKAPGLIPLLLLFVCLFIYFFIFYMFFYVGRALLCCNLFYLGMSWELGNDEHSINSSFYCITTYIRSIAVIKWI